MSQYETDKHSQIVKAAAALFAKQGYKKTTVDEIVAKANISKGLFYHYFKNKQVLYLYLYDTYVDLLSTTVRGKADREEPDLFKRLMAITKIRIAFIAEYPDLWDFLYSAYNEQHPDILPRVKEKNEQLLRSSFSSSAAGIDWAKLKKGLSPEKAIEIITWVAEGFVHKIASSPAPGPEAYSQFVEYMEYLQTGMYEE